jgi:hypothetical protein
VVLVLFLSLPNFSFFSFYFLRSDFFSFKKTTFASSFHYSSITAARCLSLRNPAKVPLKYIPCVIAQISSINWFLGCDMNEEQDSAQNPSARGFSSRAKARSRSGPDFLPQTWFLTAVLNKVVYRGKHFFSKGSCFFQKGKVQVISQEATKEGMNNWQSSQTRTWLSRKREKKKRRIRQPK